MVKHSNQGHCQKLPKEGVLRPEIAQGGGFEGAEAGAQPEMA